LYPKSLYRSCAGRHFYGAENEIWAGFVPVGNTEKKLGLMWNFRGQFFQGQKNKQFKYFLKILQRPH
jgi:hypothetical protein